MALAATALLVMAACSNPTAQKLFTTEVVPPAKLVTAAEVTNCRYLGEVTGYAEASVTGNAPLARITARDDMRQRAGHMGADCVVLSEYRGNRRVTAVGKAYQCAKP